MDFRRTAGLALCAVFLLNPVMAFAQDRGGAWLRNEKGDVINANTLFICPGTLFGGFSRTGVEVLDNYGKHLGCLFSDVAAGDKGTMTFQLTDETNIRTYLNNQLKLLPISGFPIQLPLPEGMKEIGSNFIGVQVDATAKNRSFTIIVGQVADGVLIMQLNHASELLTQAADVAWRAVHDSAADVLIGLAQSTGAAEPQFPRLLYPHLSLPAGTPSVRPNLDNQQQQAPIGPTLPRNSPTAPSEKPENSPTRPPGLPNNAPPIDDAPISPPGSEARPAPSPEPKPSPAPPPPQSPPRSAQQCATPYSGIQWVDGRLTSGRSQCLYRADTGFRGFFRTQTLDSSENIESWQFREVLILARDFPQAREDVNVKWVISAGVESFDCRSLRDGQNLISACGFGIAKMAILIQVEYSEQEGASAQKFAQWLFDQHFGTAAPSSQ